MSTRTRIFLARLRMAARNNVARAVELLRGVGKTLQQAVAIIAAIRTGRLVIA